MSNSKKEIQYETLYTKKTGQFQSTNGTSQITYYIYEPLHTPKAILQISHGMCEYIECYEDFIHFLTFNDILVCGNDHIGHKNSVASKEELGYFAEKKGWTYLVKDLVLVTKMIKKNYPDIPVFLLGHSMGSLLARVYIANYAHLIDGAIIMATSGTNPLAGLGLAATSIVQKVKGEKHRSPLLTKLFFGGYNRKYDNPETPSDWHTSDKEIVRRHIEDEYHNFTFTASAYEDLVRLLQYVSSPKWYDKVPSGLPVLLLGGDMDPLGNFGSGLKEVARKFQKKPRMDFSYIIYPNFRHEILNECDREIVYEDILEWLCKHFND